VGWCAAQSIIRDDRNLISPRPKRRSLVNGPTSSCEATLWHLQKEARHQAIQEDAQAHAALLASSGPTGLACQTRFHRTGRRRKVTYTAPPAVILDPHPNLFLDPSDATERISVVLFLGGNSARGDLDGSDIV
jgi:hypothetical protein